MDRRQTQAVPPEPLRLPSPLNQLPWNVAKDVFGKQASYFLAVMGQYSSLKTFLCYFVLTVPENFSVV